MAGSDVEGLLKRVESGKPVPAILLLGSDSYLRDLCRTKLIETYVDEGTREWAVGKFSAKQDSPDAVLGQAQMLPAAGHAPGNFLERCEGSEKAWTRKQCKS